jgi:hypothetical protein
MHYDPLQAAILVNTRKHLANSTYLQMKASLLTFHDTPALIPKPKDVKFDEYGMSEMKELLKG